jgi:DNA-binding response OmpR family regulator
MEHTSSFVGPSRTLVILHRMHWTKSTKKQVYEAPEVVKLTSEDASALFDQQAESNMNPDTLKLRALVLSDDPQLSTIFQTLFSKLKVVSRCCGEENEALTQLLGHKFEAIVLDFDSFRGILPTREKLHENHANRNLVVFAVASEESRNAAMQHGASFVFDRPLDQIRIAKVLRTAYGLMLRDRREYFRLAIESPVALRRNSGEILECKTINISRTGMAISTPISFARGETIELSLRIHEMGMSINAIGKIIWDDRHGKAGICFECKNAEESASFSAWLNNRFYAQFDVSDNS